MGAALRRRLGRHGAVRRLIPDYSSALGGSTVRISRHSRAPPARASHQNPSRYKIVITKLVIVLLPAGRRRRGGRVPRRTAPGDGDIVPRQLQCFAGIAVADTSVNGVPLRTVREGHAHPMVTDWTYEYCYTSHVLATRMCTVVCNLVGVCCITTRAGPPLTTSCSAAPRAPSEAG